MIATIPRPLLCGCSLVHQQVTRATHAGRRRGTPAATGRAGGAPSRAAAPAGGVQGYSPPPPTVSPIRGLIDFHTHAAPDIFGRAVDDDELAQLAASRQMEALVFKNHVTLTADRAWLARKHVPGIKVFGGIVLNRAVGGINPQAAEWMWRKPAIPRRWTGCRCSWPRSWPTGSPRPRSRPWAARCPAAS